MAKRKGPDSWRIPTEKEINEQYELHSVTVDDKADTIIAQSRLQINRQKQDLIQLVTIAVALIIVLVAVSLIIYVVKAKNNFTNVQNDLKNKSQQRQMNFDEDNTSASEGNGQYTNNYPQGNYQTMPNGQIPQGNYQQQAQQGNYQQQAPQGNYNYPTQNGQVSQDNYNQPVQNGQAPQGNYNYPQGQVSQGNYEQPVNQQGNYNYPAQNNNQTESRRK